MENYLFIGGHRDGLEIPWRRTWSSYSWRTATQAERHISATHSPSGALASFIFYRHEKLTPEQVLDRLVGHCKAWAVNQPGGRR